MMPMLRYLSAIPLLLLAAVSAVAEPATISRLRWVTNGIVRAAAAHDQTLYIGGDFTRVAPAANLLGPVFGVSRPTGSALPAWPLADGAVFAIEPDGSGGYFIGGRFTRIGGLPRTALARVLADGSIDTAFAPALEPLVESGDPSGPALEVKALAHVGARLFVGGSLRLVQGPTIYEGLVALDVTTGVPDAAWAPPFAARPEALFVDGTRLVVMGRILPPAGGSAAVVAAVQPDTGAPLWTRTLSEGGTVFDGVVAGGRLIVGGQFTYYGGPVTRQALISIDPATGAVDANWAPETTSQTVHAVAVIGSTLYVGGRFDSFASVPRTNLAAVDLSSGSITPWAPEVPGTVRDLAPSSGTALYVAGAFRRAGGFARSGLAEIDVAGTTTVWSPDAYSTEVRTVYVTAEHVLAGGTTAVSGGVPREDLAAFDLAEDDVLPWAPSPGYRVEALATNGSRVFAGLRQVHTGVQWEPAIAVVAFDAGTGLPAAWTAPDRTSGLSGLVDGQIYLMVENFYLRRVDADTGEIDRSMHLIGEPWGRLLAAGDLFYTTGRLGGVYPDVRWGVAAFLSRTGALSPWRVDVLPDRTSHLVSAAAVMGRTIFLIVTNVFTFEQIRIAVDRDSGITLPFPATFAGRLQDMAAADGLVIAIGVPSMPGADAVVAFRPDGASTSWAPGLTLTDSDARLRPGHLGIEGEHVIVTPGDIVITGVQRLDGIPVHGVAVIPRQAPEAPAALDAGVLDFAVRLSWDPPATPVSSYAVEVGSQPGATDILVRETGSDTPALDAIASIGTYFVRVRAAGAEPGPAAAPTNEIAVRVGCSALEIPPTNLAATVSGTSVTLTWTPPAFTSVSRYVIEAGSQRGAANLARITVPGADESFTTTAPPGTYYVRVRGENACGATPATPDVWLTVGGDALPAAPANLTVTDVTPDLPPNVPRTYVAQWPPVAGATAYLFEVGSRPGTADLLSTIVHGTSVGPAGTAWGFTYYLRVRAIGTSGTGPPSAEYALLAR